MAEKILNTRIQLKYDTLTHWEESQFNGNDSSKWLKAGEIAVVTLAPNAETNPDNKAGQHPLLFKVGTGNHKFSDLPWASALAADVHSWAKKGEEEFKTWVKTLVTVDDIDLADYYNKTEIDGLFATLGSAAYTEAEAYATAAQGGKADSAIQKITIFGTTLNNNSSEYTGAEAIAALGLKSAAFTESTAYDVAGAAATAVEQAKDYTDVLQTNITNGTVVANKAEDANKLGGIAAANYLLKSEAETGYDAKGAAAAVLGADTDEAGTATVHGALKAASGALNDAKDYVDQKFTAADLDQYTTEQDVKDIVDNVINTATDKETLDSLVELVEYIDTHSGDAINMATAIGVLEGKVDAIEKKPAYSITTDQVGKWDNEVGAKVLAETKLDATTYNTYVQDHANDYTNEQIDDAVADAKDAAIADAAGKYVTTGDFNEYKLGIADGSIQVGDAAKLGGVAANDYLTKALAATSYERIGAEDRAKEYANGLASNYATAAQGTKADNALQEITTTANGGLKITTPDETKPTEIQIDIDDSVVFVFNCGSASTVI